MIISFSGIDGSGKTTLLNHLEKELIEKGFIIKKFAMYDNITCYSIIRRLRDIFKSKKLEEKKLTYKSHLIGVDDKKNIIDKTIYKFFRSLLFKKIFFLIDLIFFYLFIFFSLLIKKKEAVYLFDRYLYDNLVDTLNYPKTNYFFENLIIKFIPKISFSFLIMTSPKEAYERKKEFEVEYNKWRQDNYRKIFVKANLNHLIIQNIDLDFAKNQIITKVLNETTN